MGYTGRARGCLTVSAVPGGHVLERGNAVRRRAAVLARRTNTRYEPAHLRREERVLARAVPLQVLQLELTVVCWLQSWLSPTPPCSSGFCGPAGACCGRLCECGASLLARRGGLTGACVCGAQGGG